MKFNVEVDTERLTGSDVSGIIKVITDDKILDNLARQFNIPAIFVAVSANKNTRKDTLDYMLNYMKNNKFSRWREICNKIAANPNSTKPILDKVIEFGYPTSVAIAIRHSNYKDK